MATSVGARGKVAESKARAYMKKRSDAEAGFYWYRYPDARAGSAQVVPADFEIVYKGRHFLLEVKEVGHDFRLPQKNFDAGKVARVMKAGLAGSHGTVLVYHTTTKLWRIMPIDTFAARQPSWDLTKFATHATVDGAMNYWFGRP